MENIVQAQPKIRDLIRGQNVKVEVEHCTVLPVEETQSIWESSMTNSDQVAVKLEPMEEETADESYHTEYLDEAEHLIEGFDIVNIEHVIQKSQGESSVRDREKEPETPETTEWIDPAGSKFTFGNYLKQFTEKNIECDLCGLKTTRRQNMEGHIERIHLRKKISAQCAVCGLHFENYKKFSRHRANAHLAVESKCSQCDYVGKNAECLRRHYRSHHEVKIICSLCGELTSRYFIKEHIRRNHQPISCELCGKEFQGCVTLRSHMKYVHENTGESCPSCQSVFPNKIKLKLHIQRQHPTELFHCPINSCNYSSSRKPYIKLHVSHHRDIDETEKEKIQQLVKMMKPVPISS